MKLNQCKETILSVMAEADGEIPLLSCEQVTQHLSRCKQCRREVNQQKETINMLQGQKRPVVDKSLWFEIEKRITEKPISDPVHRRYFFFLLSAILVVYKLLEMIPTADLGFLFKFVPLIFIVALFYFFKENPFTINTELKLEG